MHRISTRQDRLLAELHAQGKRIEELSKIEHDLIREVHPQGFDPSIKAQTPTPGSLDLCFHADCALEEVMEHFRQHNIPIEAGPVVRTGARFPIRSVYVRDPDHNLIEVSVPA